MKTRLPLYLISLLTILCVCAISAFAATSYQVANGASNYAITEHGVTKLITNSCGKDLFVPTATSTEWSNFYTYPPGCATVVNGYTYSNSVAFNYIGGGTSWSVPAGVTSIKIKVWGAGGAGGFGSSGGGGGYIEAIKSVSPGQQINIDVGQAGYTGGDPNFNGGDTYDCCGYSGAPTHNGGGGAWVTGSGGMGGGYTYVTHVASGSYLVAAGGGGGADFNYWGWSGVQPNGGGAEQNGFGNGQVGATGCTSGWQGSSGGISIGGGGGGGAGAGCGGYDSGGGGGINYISSGWTSTVSYGGNYNVPGNSGDGDRSGAGNGGGSPGANGRVVIRY